MPEELQQIRETLPGGLNVCPKGHIPSWWRELAILYRSYKAGHLYVEGGLSKQPATWPIVMGYIDAQTDKWMVDRWDRKREAARRKNKTG